MNSPQSSESSHIYFDFRCPHCGQLITKYGLDFSGSALPYCIKCKGHYLIRVADGKMIIELNFPPVYTPAENSGVNRKRG